MARLGIVIGGIFAVAGAALLSMTSIGEGDGKSGGGKQGVRAFAAPARNAGLDMRGSAPGALTVPVQGYARAKLTDSWGDARSGGRGHRGIDIMAGEGTPVVAIVDGSIEKLFDSRLGGTTLYLRSADRRWMYYYAHLAGYAAGVREGLPVRAGQVLGYVGDTGDAGPGNHHLHFSTSRMRPGDRWHEGEDVNPYPLLAGRRVAR